MIEQTKHTPGPWVTDRRYPGVIIGGVGENGKPSQVASATLSYFRSEEERVANAILIAASPNLLAGCIAMLGHVESGLLVRNVKDDDKPGWALKAMTFVRDLQAMQAAIAKATGSTP